ncbi:MAG: hypothetical protein M3Y64_01135, partial [Gemmatimonadota bacterium]|nr:hypothetical protein [Gemmatimonadota bacterium]
MIFSAFHRAAIAAVSSLAFVACSSESKYVNPIPTTVDSTALTGASPAELATLGHGSVIERYTAEVWVRGNTAYTSTWGFRGLNGGDAVKIWDVSGNQPTLVDSVLIPVAGTTGDLQVSDDGSLLAVAVEPTGVGSLALFSLANPRKPTLITRYQSKNTISGVHTAEIARVNGTLYAFCSIDPANGVPARLVILDLTNPSAPTEVAVLTLGAPFQHDVFVRNGFLFTAEWGDGLGVWDIGAINGSVAVPKRLGSIKTVGGQVHNVYWFIDPLNNSKRYAFVGEEGPGQIGFSSVGDIHVVDISNFSALKEVAVFSVPGAGTHNFSVDEDRGLLYAAFYNAGVRVLDIRGDLSACSAGQKTADGRCNLALMGREKARVSGNTDKGIDYVWGVQYVNNALYAT